MTETKRCCEACTTWENTPINRGLGCKNTTCPCHVPVSEPSLQGKIEAMLRNSHNYGEITCGYDELARDLLALVEGEKVKCTCENLYPRGKVHYRDCPATTPTPPPTEGWEEEFDKQFPFPAQNIDDIDSGNNRLKNFIRKTITQALAEQKARMVEEVEEVPVEYAHTYGSENADTYRAHDAGQEQMKERIIKALSK